jgi:hypothetical protein
LCAVTALVVVAVTAGTIGIGAPAAKAAVASQLTRYPYLTDVVQGFATVNWATDRSATKGSITYGRVGQESCTAHTVSASKTAITVKGVAEYQWKAKLSGLLANTRYCYRVFLRSTDLLGGDASPQFWSQIPAGVSVPYSFAVLGDWGDTDANGQNPAQAALMSSIASSGVRFVVGTGDTAYDGGTQSNYGDLDQTGYRVSSVFGPDFWTKVGATTPMFNTVGNHGANTTFFNVWPQDRAVAGSSGSYQMDTYCCVNGTSSMKGPSAWYAFDVGNARFYILTTSWPTSNLGTSDEYGNDFAARWQKSSPEYQWLKADLQSHPSQLKFAFFHYPLYSANATETSDTYLQGSDSLEGLLGTQGVNVAFNGHAHIYERNATAHPGLVSYVTGGGGGTPEPITKCNNVPLVQYGLGWSFTNGGSSCGAAAPTSVDQVYHYLKVDVNGSQVTVTGVNALGQTFDAMTYDFTADLTPPTTPTNLQAAAPAGNRVDLTWTASTDQNGIAAYDIYRTPAASSPIASVAGDVTSYSDTTVAPQTDYAYTVVARDPSNNASDPSNQALITTPSLDQQAPDPPTGVQATAPDAHRVDLTWTGSTDNVGVVAYDVYRDGNKVGSVDGNTTAYSDTTVDPGTFYSYIVRARDAAGNTSADSDPATVTTPSVDVLFADDFESGSLSSWTLVNGLTGEQGVTSPSGGAWVARQASSGAGGTFAYRSLLPTVNELYAKFRFQVVSRTGSVDLMRLRNSSGGSKFSLLVSGATDTLAARNNSGTTTKSNSIIVNGTWHTVEVHVANTSTVEVWLDGVHLTELDATGSVGSSAIGQILLGNTGTGTYNVVLDDLVVASSFI